VLLRVSSKGRGIVVKKIAFAAICLIALGAVEPIPRKDPNSQIAHQQLLNELSNVDLLILDDFLTVGIDHDAASDLFAILANRDHRLPTMIASQTGPAHWVGELPDRIAADSIVNRLANRARTINLGDIDMRKLRHDQTRANQTYWE